MGVDRIRGDGPPMGLVHVHSGSNPNRAEGRLAARVGARLPAHARARASRPQRPRPGLPRAREPLPPRRAREGLLAGARLYSLTLVNSPRSPALTVLAAPNSTYLP